MIRVFFNPTWLDFFWPERKKIEKFGILRENFPNLEGADQTQPENKKRPILPWFKIFWQGPITYLSKYQNSSIDLLNEEMNQHWLN